MKKDLKSKSSRKVAFASFVGTTVEWYDFYLYGAAAALIFNKLFFPQFDPVIGIVASYATYAVGFFARPLGAVIFGHFGDRIGRKSMLILTLLIMGVATFLIGLLPTYNQIGIWAPILLVILRVFQGIGVGGEWGGAIVMTAEHSRKKDRGFYTSWPNAGAPCGLLISIVMFLIFSTLPEKEFLSYGWRIPFLLGIVLTVIALFIRLRILDSPLFTKAKQKLELVAVPVFELVRTSTKSLFLAMGARFVESTSYYIFTVFILSYGTEQLGLPKNIILYGILIGSLVETFSIPLFGMLSDYIGRRPVYLFGAVAVALFAFPFFWLLQTKDTSLIWFAIAFGLSVCHSAMHGSQAAFISEMFKLRVRYSGVAIAYHLAAAFSGGLAPLIATGLVVWAKGNSWPVSIYIILMACITTVSVFLAKESFHKDISR